MGSEGSPPGRPGWERRLTTSAPSSAGSMGWLRLASRSCSERGICSELLKRVLRLEFSGRSAVEVEAVVVCEELTVSAACPCSRVWTLPMVPAVVFEHVALCDFAKGGIVRRACAGDGGSVGKGSCGAGVVAGVGGKGAFGLGLGGTDCFDHFVSFYFDFSVSQFAHEAEELAVAKFIGLVVFDLFQ